MNNYLSETKTWLITGGAGFIGSHLVKYLLRNKQNVIVLDNLSSSDGSLLADVKQSIKFIKGDIRHIQDVLQAVKGVDYILHHAALVSVPQSVDNPELTQEINSQGTFNVLFAAHKEGVKRIVFASSSAVYGDTEIVPCKEDNPLKPQSPYAQTKLEGEKLCKSFYQMFGLECVILRYFNVFGPGQNPLSPYAAVVAKFIDAAKTGDTFTIDWDGKQSRDFVFVEDVVNANMIAALNALPGEVYNVSGGKAYSLLELSQIIEELAGKQMKRVFRPKRQGDIKISAADISKITKQGFAPATTLKQGLAVMINAGRDK